MEFCRPHIHENHLKPHLQCGTDPRIIRPHTRPFRTHRTAEGNHRRSRTDFSWRNIGFRASALSQKRQFVRDFLQHTISALFFINSGLQFQSNLKIAGSQIPLFPFFFAHTECTNTQYVITRVTCKQFVHTVATFFFI